MSKLKTNLLFIIHGLGFGGSELMLVNLVNRLDQDKFNISVVSLSDYDGNQIQPEVAKVLIFPRNWRYDLRPAKQIQHVVLDSHIDIIIVFDVFSYFYAWKALSGSRAKPKIFISIHETLFINFKNYFQNFIYTRLLSGNEKFISVCNSQANYWSKVYWIPLKRFITIYNGIDSNYFCPSNDIGQRNSIRANLSIPEDALVVLQVANLNAFKRHEDSLVALKHLIDSYPARPYYLMIVGDGTKEEKWKLRTTTEQLNILDRVRFCGFQKDVRPFYESADIFTLSSARETFSVAALEAMSMGLPCVLTDIGGAREMIVEGMNGYIVQPYNPDELCNAWFVTLESLERFDRNKIREYVVEHFSLKKCVHEYEKLFIK
jgi:glycosyltransferase involved in cell wall biosynthesis